MTDLTIIYELDFTKIGQKRDRGAKVDDRKYLPGSSSINKALCEVWDWSVWAMCPLLFVPHFSHTGWRGGHKFLTQREGANIFALNVKGEQKKTYQSFFTIIRSNFTQILKSWTFLNSSSSWLLKNVQDHWIWAKFDRDIAKMKKVRKLWKYGKYIEN